MTHVGVTTSENMSHARQRNSNIITIYQQNTEVTRSSCVLAQHSSGVTSTSIIMVNNCRPIGMGVTIMNYRRPSLKDIQGIVCHSHIHSPFCPTYKTANATPQERASLRPFGWVAPPILIQQMFYKSTTLMSQHSFY
jgi:hypothetical protein